MPGLKKTSVGSGDQKWLASAHGINNARTCALKKSDFVAGTHYPKGFFPSGLEVNAADEGNVKPWTGAAGEKLGFILFDQTVADDAYTNGAVLRHGESNVGKLPVAHIAPTNAADSAGFVFITEAN